MKPAKLLSATLLIAGFLGLWLLKNADPVVRLLAASAGLIWLIKAAALSWQSAYGARPKSRFAFLAFLFLWPGISVAGFTERRSAPAPGTGARFFESWLSLLTGTGILLAVSLSGPRHSLFLDYVALLSVFLIVHVGLVEVAADALRLAGFTPKSLFDRPHLASSLRDFWSVRWNRAFVDMNKIFLLNGLRGRIPGPLLTFSLFVVSGLLHELGISYADGVSWGHPLAYFAFQGLGMEIERRKKLPRLLIWLWILAPLPLLFTPAFTTLFLGGLRNLIADDLSGLSARQMIPPALVLGGALHLLVLCASVQVPGKLGWREDFQKLRPLNRKVFWTYGAYIFAIIVFMALVSFTLAGERSSTAGLLWVAFIALFWWARVLTDFFYMAHDDWPRGPLFEIGHVCLTTVFLSLAALYSAVGYWLLEGMAS